MEKETSAADVTSSENLNTKATSNVANDSAPPTEPITDSTTEKTAQKKISKKNKILVCLTFIVLLVIAGVMVWYFFFRTPEKPQNDQTSTEYVPRQISELTLKDNSLSDFDLTFLKLNDNADNIVYSPLSIKYALGMLASGANGDTKTQITTLIGNYQPKAYLNNANRSLANAMFVRKESSFEDLIKDSYINDLKAKYGSSIIYDSFESPDNANKWINDETLGVIDNLFDEDNFNTERDFALVNALAIDMEWNNQLQCTEDIFYAAQSSDSNGLKCKYYSIRYAHENYHDSIDIINHDKGFSKQFFNNNQEVPVAEIGASANRYNIIEELGEDYIRKTVQTEYDKWLEEGNEDSEDHPFNLDEYMQKLKDNYGRLDESTDFLFYDSNDEKVFGKYLREYDGATLEYVGIMPKNAKLDDYIKTLDANKIADIISNLKVSSSANSYKDGVVTRIRGSLPFFNYSYSMKDFKKNLQQLGVTNVFDQTKADLSNMVDLENCDDNAFIMDALHKANIDFSNNGIKAAAITAVIGGMGATGGGFDYEWDVPIEEIDLTFDKPFLYIIRDKATGEVWFTGAVYNI